MLIDGHFHIYKSEQAGILAQGGASHMGFRGTLEEALGILDREKIDKIVALAVIPIEPMRRAAMEKWPAELAASERATLQEERESELERLASQNATDLLELL
jgi:hypothetical protein